LETGASLGKQLSKSAVPLQAGPEVGHNLWPDLILGGSEPYSSVVGIIKFQNLDIRRYEVTTTPDVLLC
jgi:hypothetical protein